MNAWATVSAALLRVLGVLGVVAGVFAMHGLTADHMPAMSGMHGAQPADRMPEPHHAANSVQASNGEQADAVVPPGMQQVAPLVAMVDGVEQVLVAVAGEPHGMSGACVAVLNGLLLLLALALGLRSLLAWRAVVLLAPAERLVLSERSPPWLAPSLSKLCVLRT